MPPDARVVDDADIAESVEVRGVSVNYHAANQRLRDVFVGMEAMEPDLLDWIEGMEPDSVLYDIGASTGPFTMFAAVRGLQLVAFEPEAQNHAVLEMNHYLNRGVIKHPVTALNVALSDEPSMGTMWCRNYVAGSHVKTLDEPFRRLERDTFDAEHVQPVIKDSLDQMIGRLGLPAPDFIKIDIDGREVELLDGAADTLSGPTLKQVFIEIAHPGSHGSAIGQQIMSHGYTERMRRQVEDYDGLFNVLYERT